MTFCTASQTQLEAERHPSGYFAVGYSSNRLKTPDQIRTQALAPVALAHLQAILRSDFQIIRLKGLDAKIQASKYLGPIRGDTIRADIGRQIRQ